MRTAFALSLCLSLLVPALGQAQDKGCASPAEVWTRYKAARTDKETDVAALLKISTPAFQSNFAELAVMAAGMSTMGNKARRAKLIEIMAGHGFGERDRMTAKKFKAIKDKVKFLGEVVAFSETSKKMTSRIPTGSLEGLVIKGETAQALGPHRAKGAPRAKASSQQMAFKRVAGVWYLDVASEGARKRRKKAKKESKLDTTKVNLRLPGQTLKSAGGFLEIYGVNVGFGKGVDPEAKVDLILKGVILREALDRIAESAKVAWKWSEKESLVTFVPKS